MIGSGVFDRHPKLQVLIVHMVDSKGFNPIGLRAEIEMRGVDRVVFGSDYCAVRYGIEEHVQIVEDVLPGPAERELVLWRTSDAIFHLGLDEMHESDAVAVGASA